MARTPQHGTADHLDRRRGRRSATVRLVLRARLAEPAPLPACAVCRPTPGRRFDRLIDCRRVLREVGITGDAGHLSRAESPLAEAREHPRTPKAEDAVLLGEPREPVAAAARRARRLVRYRGRAGR
jgi:hypothetical protein